MNAEEKTQLIQKALADAKAALKNVEPEVDKLANDPRRMDWGEVSDYGCTVSHGIDDALRAIELAVEAV